MFDHLSGTGHHFRMAGPLSDVMVFGTGIAAQCSANCSRNTDQVFQAGQTFPHGRRDQMSQFCAAPATITLSLTVISEKAAAQSRMTSPGTP